MTISIPDTLTTDNSGKYIMSIRLRPGGLSFSAYQPGKPGSFFLREIKLDQNVPYISSLKEFFFANDFLTWAFKRIHILSSSTQYTLVPLTIFEEKKKEEFLSFNFSLPETSCLTNRLEEEQAVVVFGMDKEVYEFCTRSFINPEFTQHITPQLLSYRQENRTRLGKRMYVATHDTTMDIVCYDNSKLVFVNSFRISQAEDVIYYILNVWRQLGFDQLKDDLFFDSHSKERKLILETLKTYIKMVDTPVIPTEIYLLGDEVKQAPADIIALTICGL